MKLLIRRPSTFVERTVVNPVGYVIKLRKAKEVGYIISVDGRRFGCCLTRAHADRTVKALYLSLGAML